MGMSASQARFLQLTARQSDTEYKAQRINFERLALSEQLTEASSEYNDKTFNYTMLFTYKNGDGDNKTTLTYKNYKNYMNKQLDGLQSSSQQYFLVSSSGKSIVVGSEEDMNEIIDKNRDENGNSKFSESDFLIAEDLDDADNFQNAIKEGIYYFATLGEEKYTDENGQTITKNKFDVKEWSNMSEMTEVLDTSDDAAAEAEYEHIQTVIQNKDKKLEMELNQLETDRKAISTEIESVKTVIKDNIESSFKTFG